MNIGTAVIIPPVHTGCEESSYKHLTIVQDITLKILNLSFNEAPIPMNLFTMALFTSRILL